MRRAPLVSALLGLLVLALSAGTWFFLRPSPSGAAVSPGVRGPRDARPAELGEGLGGTQRDGIGGVAAEGGAGRSVVPAPTDAERAGVERVVHGRIELPFDCRSEGALTVYALDRKATADELVQALYRERHGERPRPPDAELLEDFTRRAQQARPLVLARAPLDAEGRFELRLGSERERVHILALGQLAYQTDSRAVELGAERVQVLLGLACGAELLGVLVPPAGKPAEELADTELRVRMAAVGRMTEDLSRTTRADALGRFSFEGLPARVDVELLVSPKAHPAMRIELGRLPAGERRELRVELESGARAVGVVLDEAGRPVPGARVAALPEGSLFDLDWSTRTETCDEEGRFDLVGLKPGRVMLRATAAGFLDSEFERLELGPGAARTGLELRLSRGRSIAGRVSWPDGRPAVEARVQVTFDPTQRMGMGAYGGVRGARGSARSDAEGRFRVTGLGPGPFALRIEAAPPEDLVTPEDESWAVHVDSVAPDGPELEVVLRAPEGVRGRVADRDGAPIGRFRIFAVHVAAGSGVEVGIEELERTFEDEAGRFRLSGLTPGKWRLFALAEGFAGSGAESLDLPRPPESEPLEFVLDRAARVEGIVLGFEGRPVGAAEVRLADDQGPLARILRLTPEPPGDRTDAGGRFQIEGLPPGSISLVARGEGYASSPPRVLELGPGEQATGVELVLREGGRISGEVYSEGGTPAAGATLQLLNAGDMSWRFERTDHEGRFLATRLDPGLWRVLHMPRGFATDSIVSAGADQLDVGEMMREMAIAMAEVADGETVHVVLGAPPEDPVRLSGRVLLAGEAYPRALVTFYREGTKALERMRSTSSREDGSFELVLDAPGGHFVQVQRVGNTPTEQSTTEFLVDIPQAPEHQLTFDLPGGRISGRLVAPGGASVEGVRVSLLEVGPLSSGSFLGGHYSETISDGQGRFEVVGLRAGTYDLAVGGMRAGGLFGSEAGFAREVRRVVLREDEHARDVDFRLRPPGTLAVRVVDEIGQPVPEASIFVREHPSGSLLERLSLLKSSPQGSAEYGGLGEGRYSVSARKGGRASQETPAVTVRPGETAQIQVVLEEGTVLRLELLDGEGEPLRARYAVRDAQGREYQGMYGMEDLMELLGQSELSRSRAQVGPLPPGDYTVQATSEDGREAQRPVSLRGQRERILRLRLR